jgi:hypothetical protein
MKRPLFTVIRLMWAGEGIPRPLRGVELEAILDYTGMMLRNSVKLRLTV